jgi:GR25 family glycosyltransferase involved in LPS biosynthesis
MRCIASGLQLGALRIAIFEDDIFFHRFDPARLSEGIRFLKSLPHWDAFFLGCLVTRSCRTGSPVMRQVRYRGLAHAYVLNRPFAEKLSALPWSGRPFDAVLRDAAQATYAIYPSIAFQSSAGSDNQRLKRLDRFRRLCGGLQFIQSVNEKYHRHFGAMLFLHLLVGLVAAGLFYAGFFR